MDVATAFSRSPVSRGGLLVGTISAKVAGWPEASSGSAFSRSPPTIASPSSSPDWTFARSDSSSDASATGSTFTSMRGARAAACATAWSPAPFGRSVELRSSASFASSAIASGESSAGTNAATVPLGSITASVPETGAICEPTSAPMAAIITNMITGIRSAPKMKPFVRTVCRNSRKATARMRRMAAGSRRSVRVSAIA